MEFIKSLESTLSGILSTIGSITITPALLVIIVSALVLIGALVKRNKTLVYIVLSIIVMAGVLHYFGNILPFNVKF